MSHTVPSLLAPVLVEEDVDDEPPSTADPLEEEAAVEPSAPPETVVTTGWVPPKFEVAPPPPHAGRAPVTVRARRGTRMISATLANPEEKVTPRAEASVT